MVLLELLVFIVTISRFYFRLNWKKQCVICICNVLKDETLRNNVGEVISTPRVKCLLQLERIVFFINDTTFVYLILKKSSLLALTISQGVGIFVVKTIYWKGRGGGTKITLCHFITTHCLLPVSVMYYLK